MDNSVLWPFARSIFPRFLVQILQGTATVASLTYNALFTIHKTALGRITDCKGFVKDFMQAGQWYSVTIKDINECLGQRMNDELNVTGFVIRRIREDRSFELEVFYTRRNDPNIAQLINISANLDQMRALLSRSKEYVMEVKRSNFRWVRP